MREGVKVAAGVGVAGIMSMHFVIGRRASSLRNSLFFDCQNNAVYTCGRNILRLSLTNLKQTVLYE
jgi:predicted ferric reductase